jgi:hypothetical protein
MGKRISPKNAAFENGGIRSVCLSDLIMLAIPGDSCSHGINRDYCPVLLHELMN